MYNLVSGRTNVTGSVLASVADAGADNVVDVVNMVCDEPSDRDGTIENAEMQLLVPINSTAQRADTIMDFAVIIVIVNSICLIGLDWIGSDRIGSDQIGLVA